MGTTMSAAEFKDQGNKHLKAEEFDKAIECYTKAIELNPNEHTYYSNRSAAYLSKGDGQTALYDAIKCVDVKPDWPKGHARKGAALHALKQYTEAKQAYEEGLKLDPNDPGCLSGVKEVQKILSAPAGSGGGALGGLFNQQMLSKLATHPKFGPKLADPTFKMKLQMMQTNPQMMMQDPEMMEVLSALIGVGGAGDDDDDKTYTPPPPKPAAKEEPKKPAEPDYSNMTEEEKAEAQKKQKAIEAKDKGNAFYKEKKFDDALSAYDEAMEIDPTNIMIRNNKAAVYIELNETDKAIQICKDAIEYAKEN